jgi:hypothetical protein
MITDEITLITNYWFDDYQQAGDKYNIQNASVFQKPGWKI